MDTTMRFRVATSEKARYEEAARRSGQSLSKWAREGLGSAADCDLEPGVFDEPPREDRPNPPPAGEQQDIVEIEIEGVPPWRPRSKIDPNKIDAFQRQMARKK